MAAAVKPEVAAQAEAKRQELEKLQLKARIVATRRFDGEYGSGAYKAMQTKAGKVRLEQLFAEELDKRKGQILKLERFPGCSLQVREATPYWLYLLECQGGRLYAGVAIDVEERFTNHVLGRGARFTKAFPPIRVAAAKSYATKSEALSAEYALKQLPKAEKILFFEENERAVESRPRREREA